MEVWIALVLGIWLLVFLLRKKEHWTTYFLFSVFDGIMMGLLCMHILPLAFGEPYFFYGVLGLLLGVVISTFFEQISGDVFSSSWLHCVAFTITVLLFCGLCTSMIQNPGVLSFITALLGGILLFISCGGILPEGKSQIEKIFRGMGGILGFLLGVLL